MVIFFGTPKTLTFYDALTPIHTPPKVRNLKRKAGEDVENKEGGGGGGISRVLSDGDVFEKAGINFASVHGEIQKVGKESS